MLPAVPLDWSAATQTPRSEAVHFGMTLDVACADVAAEAAVPRPAAIRTAAQAAPHNLVLRILVPPNMIIFFLSEAAPPLRSTHASETAISMRRLYFFRRIVAGREETGGTDRGIPLDSGPGYVEDFCQLLT